MKIKKQLTTYLFMALAIVFIMSCEQKNDAGSNAPKDDAEGEKAVKAVLWEYKSALEALNIDDTEKLFTAESQIIENGGIEGTYKDYKGHHIGPELEHMESFKFNNYKVKVIMAGDYAFGTETYVLVLTLKEEGKVIELKGVGTSVLHKEGGQWKIMKSHGSSRRVKKK